ncbi:MAG: type IV pilus assembly protein PilM [Akkermansiaceae bacterium]|nr:type IV pilus assembly protein PilM [Armatimonadota bacterium]
MVGIDIGSSALKAIQVEPTRDGFRVIRAAQQKTPVGAIRDGVVQDRDAVANAIRQMLKAANITANSAVIAVSGPTVFVRQIQLPKMPDAAMKRSIPYEAGRFISSNVDDSSIAYEILGPADEDPNLLNIMLVAAPKEMVESRIAAVERAGLDVVSADLESFALIRSLIETQYARYNDGNLRALVDIGAGHTEVTILLGTRFQLTRAVSIAGDTFTDALKNQLRVDVAEAETRKAELDLNVLIQGSDNPQDYEAPRAVQNVIDELLREVRRSIVFYQSQLPEGTPQQNISEMILAGGSAQMMGLAQYVTARLGLEARVGDPFENPGIEAAPEAMQWLRTQAPRLGCVLGLAMKDFMGTSHQVK